MHLSSTFTPLNLLGVYTAIFLLGVGLSSVVLAFSLRSTRMERPMQFVSLITMPLMFASNTFFPVSLMPEWMQAIAKVNPLTYMTDAVRQLTILPLDVSALMIDFAYLGIFATALATIGIVTGLTGASGVMVVVPLVNLLLNFSVHESIGTSLMVDVIAPLLISLTYHKYGNVDLKSGIWTAIGSILGAQLGANFTAKTPETGLGGAFGILLVLMGMVMWKRGIDKEVIVKKFCRLVKFKTRTQRILATLILGFIIGIISGIYDASGGIMVLVTLIFVLNFPLHLAIGTSTLIMTITATSGALGYALHGNIRPIAGLIIGLSAACVGIGSAKFANEVSEKILAKAIGAIFILLGIIMTVARLLGIS